MPASRRFWSQSATINACWRNTTNPAPTILLMISEMAPQTPILRSCKICVSLTWRLEPDASSLAEESAGYASGGQQRNMEHSQHMLTLSCTRILHGKIFLERDMPCLKIGKNINTHAMYWSLRDGNFVAQMVWSPPLVLVTLTAAQPARCWVDRWVRR